MSVTEVQLFWFPICIFPVTKLNFSRYQLSISIFIISQLNLSDFQFWYFSLLNWIFLISKKKCLDRAWVVGIAFALLLNLSSLLLAAVTQAIWSSPAMWKHSFLLLKQLSLATLRRLGLYLPHNPGLVFATWWSVCFSVSLWCWPEFRPISAFKDERDGLHLSGIQLSMFLFDFLHHQYFIWQCLLFHLWKQKEGLYKTPNRTTVTQRNRTSCLD